MSDSSLTILIGDDSILARKQLRDMIANFVENPVFIEAANGQEAVDRYKESKPRLVFLDIVMPIKDGIAAVKEIIAENPKAEIIIASSVGTKDQLMAAIEAGARDFIQKPIREDEVHKVIESHLKGE